jgi:tetratricopeptide (TPR) repeat protein
LGTFRKLVGAEHPVYASSLCNVGYALIAMNQLQEAEKVFREALAVYQKTVGEQHSDSQICRERLAEIFEKTGRLTEAEAGYRNLHPQGVHHGLVRILRRQGKQEEADAALEKAVLEIMRVLEAAKKQSPKDPVLEALLCLIDARWRQGRVSEAGFALKEALDLVGRSTATKPMPDQISFTVLKHAALQVLYGLEAEHGILSRQMIDWAEQQPRYGQKGRAARMLNIRPVDDPHLQATALTLARSALAGSPTNALCLWYQLNLGLAEFRSGQYAEAERTLLRSEQDGPERWRTSARVCTSKFYRAMILARQGNESGARQLFAEAEAAMDPVPPVVHHALALGADCDELMLWIAYKEAKAALNPPSR